MAFTDLLEPDFKPHFDTWRADPSPKNSSALLQATAPVLDSALRSYGGSNPSPTLKSRAKLMALDAMKTYDPTRAKLRTHLMVQLQGLRRHSARESQMVSLPERVGLDMHRLSQAENELRDELSRDPSDTELMEHTGLSLKRLQHIRQAKPAYAEGFIHSRTASEENPGGMDPAIQQTGPNPHLLDFVYHDLDPIDQVILEHTIGLHGKRVLPKQEIARRVGVSAAAISQRASRIQERLNLMGDSQLLGG